MLLQLHSLTEGEFVGGFERGSTDAAEDCGAIATNQGVLYGPRTAWAPKVIGWWNRGWWILWLIQEGNTGHSLRA
jgi:hypothetical protein